MTTYNCTVIYGWYDIERRDPFEEKVTQLWDKVDIEVVDDWKNSNLARRDFREYIEEKALDRFDETIGLKLNLEFVYVRSIGKQVDSSDVDIAPDWADKWPH